MKNLLIGSRALNFWFPDHKIKESTDWDIISDKPFEDIPEGVNYEWHDPDILLNCELEKYASSVGRVFNGKVVFIKFNGWYASHYGSEYRDFEFVTPQQRTIIVYE